MKSDFETSVAVVGAGPAGLALVGTLLDLRIKKIFWIDPNFEAGSLSKYKYVPRYTKYS